MIIDIKNDTDMKESFILTELSDLLVEHGFNKNNIYASYHVENGKTYRITFKLCNVNIDVFVEYSKRLPE